MVYRLLSEWCVATSFYQSSANHVSFYPIFNLRNLLYFIGQIREVDEPFEMDGMKAMFPGDFGDPAEDCNCRCVSMTKSRWALDSEETKWLGRTENMTDEQLQPIADKLHIPVSELRKYGNQIIPVKADSYDDFVRQYNKIWNYENSARGQKTNENYG